MSSRRDRLTSPDQPQPGSRHRGRHSQERNHAHQDVRTVRRAVRLRRPAGRSLGHSSALAASALALAVTLRLWLRPCLDDLLRRDLDNLNLRRRRRGQRRRRLAAARSPRFPSQVPPRTPILLTPPGPPRGPAAPLRSPPPAQPTRYKHHHTCGPTPWPSKHQAAQETRPPASVPPQRACGPRGGHPEGNPSPQPQSPLQVPPAPLLARPRPRSARQDTHPPQLSDQTAGSTTWSSYDDTGSVGNGQVSDSDD